MIATLRSAGAILALAWMAHAAPPAGPPATPESWAVAVAGSIVSRNPGTPRDRLAHWSYVTGYTLNGIEIVGAVDRRRQVLGFHPAQRLRGAVRPGELRRVRQLSKSSQRQRGGCRVSLGHGNRRKTRGQEGEMKEWAS